MGHNRCSGKRRRDRRRRRASPPNTEPTAPWTALPPELWETVAGFCSLADLLHMAQCCSGFHAMANTRIDEAIDRVACAMERACDAWESKTTERDESVKEGRFMCYPVNHRDFWFDLVADDVKGRAEWPTPKKCPDSSVLWTSELTPKLPIVMCDACEATVSLVDPDRTLWPRMRLDLDTPHVWYSDRFWTVGNMYPLLSCAPKQMVVPSGAKRLIARYGLFSHTTSSHQDQREILTIHDNYLPQPRAHRGHIDAQPVHEEVDVGRLVVCHGTAEPVAEVGCPTGGGRRRSTPARRMACGLSRLVSLTLREGSGNGLDTVRRPSVALMCDMSCPTITMVGPWFEPRFRIMQLPVIPPLSGYDKS